MRLFNDGVGRRHLVLPRWAFSFFAAIAFMALGFQLVAADAGSGAGRPVNPVFASIDEIQDLPNVLLIGDSISIGYTLPARHVLEGRANLHRIPMNGGPTTNGIVNLDKWLGEKKWDLIHFNWGLHDLKIMPDGRHMVPEEDYEKNLRRLVARLKKTGATLIWASTTPVPDEELNPPRKPGDILEYNAIAEIVMNENGITIDDLYSFALPRLKEIQRPANVHFTEEGSALLAGQVVTSIENALRGRAVKNLK
ncbi:MAG: SGNH/GDSL hydrolase family protein [Verrucomicrobia bacterium]|nr:SGNH/GDSL hydrolase family protein [Verrucomicrobiota bacterium]